MLFNNRLEVRALAARVGLFHAHPHRILLQEKPDHFHHMADTCSGHTCFRLRPDQAPQAVRSSCPRWLARRQPRGKVGKDTRHLETWHPGIHTLRKKISCRTTKHCFVPCLGENIWPLKPQPFIRKIEEKRGRTLPSGELRARHYGI